MLPQPLQMCENYTYLPDFANACNLSSPIFSLLPDCLFPKPLQFLRTERIPEVPTAPAARAASNHCTYGAVTSGAAAHVLVATSMGRLIKQSHLYIWGFTWRSQWHCSFGMHRNLGFGDETLRAWIQVTELASSNLLCIAKDLLTEITVHWQGFIGGAAAELSLQVTKPLCLSRA